MLKFGRMEIAAAISDIVFRGADNVDIEVDIAALLPEYCIRGVSGAATRIREMTLSI